MRITDLRRKFPNNLKAVPASDLLCRRSVSQILVYTGESVARPLLHCFFSLSFPHRRHLTISGNQYNIIKFSYYLQVLLCESDLASEM